MLGQHATKEAPGRKCKYFSSLIVFPNRKCQFFICAFYQNSSSQIVYLKVFMDELEQGLLDLTFEGNFYRIFSIFSFSLMFLK